MAKALLNLDHLGHRARARNKFLVSLGEELQDYELLEILLFSASARKDTKIVAKRLINKFGDISSVINGDTELLKDVEGVGDASIVQIKIVWRIIQRILKNSVKDKVVLDNWQNLLNYASLLLKDLNYEVFHVLFLDKKYNLIEDKTFAIGENDKVIVSAKSIARKALLLSASAVVLMHNHPSGNNNPSQSDIKTTNEICAVLNKLEIKVIDHLIISSQGYFSFRENCLL